MYKNQKYKYKKAEFFLKIRVFLKSKILREKDIFDKKDPRYLSFCESRKFITSLKFDTIKDYEEYLADTKIQFLHKKPRTFYIKGVEWWGKRDYIGIEVKDSRCGKL
jgi:hypothetical protein